MVRDDCVNEKARSPTDYVWVIPWRHGSQTAYRLLTYQNGSYRLDTRGKESARTYAFTQPGMVNGLLQQYELEQPDFLAVLRVDKCYLYVQKQERQVFIPFYLEQNAAGEPVDVTRMITMDSMRRAVVQEAAALYRQCQSDPYLRLYYYFGGRHDPIVYLEAAQSMLGTS